MLTTKKKVTARCFKSVQFESAAAIVKEDMSTNTTLTTPDTDSWRRCLVCSY